MVGYPKMGGVTPYFGDPPPHCVPFCPTDAGGDEAQPSPGEGRGLRRKGRGLGWGGRSLLATPSLLVGPMAVVLRWGRGFCGGGAGLRLGWGF